MKHSKKTSLKLWPIRCNSEQADIYGRVAMFVVFFWFGFLKLFYLSPAADLVNMLLSETLPWWSFNSFFIFLGAVEMLIGLLFLVPKWTKYALPILIVHMITTFGPLVLVPEAVWQAPFIPTLEGQYIIKNVALIALGLSIYSHTVQSKRTHK